MSRPSKAKRELRRKALLLASQERALHNALISRHKEAAPVAPVRPRADNGVQGFRGGLDNAEGRALFGPRHWSLPEIVEVAERKLGRVEAAKYGHMVNATVAPTKGATKKRGAIDGFRPKDIDALLALKTRL